MEVIVGGVFGLLLAILVVVPGLNSCEQKAELKQAVAYEAKLHDCLAEKNTKTVCEAALRQLGYHLPSNSE